ncbi:hypothetical protein D3C76_1535370 [compost metagenome]
MISPESCPVLTKETTRSGEEPSKRAASLAVKVFFSPNSSAAMYFILRLMGASACSNITLHTVARTEL